MRVWSAGGYPPQYVGSVVDVMGKVDTKDGQRLLGQWNSDGGYDATDLTSSTHSLEAVILATKQNYYDPDLPNVSTVGIVNRDLGGTSLGNNPGIYNTSDPSYGLYNIGDYVTVWGQVMETGNYQFDQNGWYTLPYMRIDDGSAVPSGNHSYDTSYGTTGVTVFGTSYQSWNASVGDYVSVKGISSVWKPSTSTGPTYRSILTSDNVSNYTTGSMPDSASNLVYGTISGTVKL